MYELREQHITPDECEPYGLWHIVEVGALRALCGHTVVGDGSVSRALAELAVIDLDCSCDPCQQIHRGIAARVL